MDYAHQRIGWLAESGLYPPIAPQRLSRGCDMGVSGQVGAPADHDPHRRDLVSITVNRQPVEIHRGHQPVSEIKRVGNVPVADELAEVVNGKLVPLDYQSAVTIKGCEEFVSHPRDSAAS